MYSFTLDADSFVEGSISGDGSTSYPYIGFHITSDCVDVATECAASAQGSAGGTLAQTLLSAGTYYLTISTWASPQSAAFVLNLSASAVVEGCMDANADNYNADATVPCDDCCE